MFKLINNDDFLDFNQISVEDLSIKLVASINSLDEDTRKEFGEILEVFAEDINNAKECDSSKKKLIEDIMVLDPKIEISAQRYNPKSGPEVGMKGEPLRTQYLPWQGPQMGAIPDVRTEEGRRFWEGKRPKFKDPDLYNKQWYLGPYADDVLAESNGARPDFSQIQELDKRFLRKEMQKDIWDALTGASARQAQESVPPEERSIMPSAPRPFMMDMVYKYLLVNENYDAAEKFANDGVDAASRHGFNTKWVLKRLFDNMTDEDLFDYWYSITQRKILPLVNPEYVDNRFGSLAMGQNITDLYNGWVENTPVIQREDVFRWTDLPWKELEAPVEEVKQQPDQPYRTPEIPSELPSKDQPIQQVSKPFWDEDLMQQINEEVEKRNKPIVTDLSKEPAKKPVIEQKPTV